MAKEIVLRVRRKIRHLNIELRATFITVILSPAAGGQLTGQVEEHLERLWPAHGGHQERARAAGLEHEVLDGSHAEVRILPLHVVPATVAKGLEFDQVVVVEPAAIAAAEPDVRSGLRRLYVVLTRAVSGLTVVHAEALPDALAGDEVPAGQTDRST